MCNVPLANGMWMQDKIAANLCQCYNPSRIRTSCHQQNARESEITRASRKIYINFNFFFKFSAILGEILNFLAFFRKLQIFCQFLELNLNFWAFSFAQFWFFVQFFKSQFYSRKALVEKITPRIENSTEYWRWFSIIVTFPTRKHTYSKLAKLF